MQNLNFLPPYLLLVPGNLLVPVSGRNTCICFTLRAGKKGVPKFKAESLKNKKFEDFVCSKGQLPTAHHTTGTLVLPLSFTQQAEVALRSCMCWCSCNDYSNAVGGPPPCEQFFLLKVLFEVPFTGGRGCQKPPDPGPAQQCSGTSLPWT